MLSGKIGSAPVLVIAPGFGLLPVVLTVGQLIAIEPRPSGSGMDVASVELLKCSSEFREINGGTEARRYRQSPMSKSSRHVENEIEPKGAVRRGRS